VRQRQARLPWTQDAVDAANTPGGKVMWMWMLLLLLIGAPPSTQSVWRADTVDSSGIAVLSVSHGRAPRWAAGRS
jgi:hypothetical protein